MAQNAENMIEKIAGEDVNFYEYAIGQIKSTFKLMDEEMTEATGREHNLNSIFDDCIDEVLNYFRDIKFDEEAIDRFEDFINEKGGLN